MLWIELKSKVIQSLKGRGLSNPNIRINALNNLERLIKTHFPNIYKNPSSLLQIDRKEFIKRLSEHKKLNSAEKSVIKNLYDFLSNTEFRSFKKERKNDSEKKVIIKTKNKLLIVASDKKIENPLYGLEPVINEETKVLILGTFPAKESIEADFYYQNQIKRFWGQALNYFSSFEQLSNDEREKLLLEKGIGLWDIFECVERGNNNQDSSITKAKFNDIENILDKYPSIKYIIFNGKNAFNWLNEYQSDLFKRDNLEYKALQSSSGGNGHFNQGKDWEEYFKTIFN